MGTTSDADTRAFGTVAAVPGATCATVAAAEELSRGAARGRPRRVWPWMLLALAALFVATVVAATWVLGETLDQRLGGLDIRIDDERIFSVPRDEAAWWAQAAALLAAVVVLVVVPLTLLLAPLITAVALAAVMVVTLGVAAVALSPLWVVGLTLWLALRAPRTPRGPRVRSAG